jgi:glycerol-1-phosphate dehydrogenase [NAD(P)+]
VVVFEASSFIIKYLSNTSTSFLDTPKLYLNLRGYIVSSIHSIELPKKVIVGSGAITRVRDVVEEITGCKESVGVITGENTYKVGGELVESIVGSCVEPKLIIVKTSMLTEAESIVERAKNEAVRLVMGVGGGKAIDVAKYVGYKIGVPVISVPLAPSHDGIASPFASLKGTSKPYSIRVMTPHAIIADIDIISKAPRKLILSGIGDLLGKFVSVRDWRLAHRLKGEYYGEYAAQLALLSAKHVLKYHEIIASGSPEGVRILVEALVSSGVSMCIAGSSRPASGSEHLFSHALEAVAPGKAHHGEAVAIGTVIMLYIYGDPLWRRIRSVMGKIGLPTRARDLGITSEEVIKALTIAHTIRPERYTILGESGLNREAAIRALRETGIID